MINKREKRYRRHRRVRAKIKGTATRPRFSVFRSHQYIYGQLIDDEKGRTLINGSDLELEKVKSQKSKVKITAPDFVFDEVKGGQAGQNPKLKQENIKAKTDMAYQIGRLIAEKALEKGIKKVVFDRGGYKYHGRIKAMAEGAREGGLEF